MTEEEKKTLLFLLLILLNSSDLTGFSINLRFKVKNNKARNT